MRVSMGRMGMRMCTHVYWVGITGRLGRRRQKGPTDGRTDGRTKRERVSGMSLRVRVYLYLMHVHAGVLACIREYPW